MAPGPGRRLIGSRQRTVRSILIGLGVGLGVAVAATGVVFALVAIPIQLSGSGTAEGLDRDQVRLGLFAVAMPAGAVVGAALGFLVGRWYARGARLPEMAGR
jgi:membrane protein DedA with SNARE-associated domain